MSFLVSSVKRFIVGLCITIYSACLLALEPEDVLGEYWKDPLFGAAQSDYTIQIEILAGRLFSHKPSVPVGKNVRFLVMNRTNNAHMLAFSSDPQALLNDETFLLFRDDTLKHADQKPLTGSHKHASSSVDDADAIVKTLDKQPSVFVRGNETKEILIHFDSPQDVVVFCALNDDDADRHSLKLNIQAMSWLTE